MPDMSNFWLVKWIGYDFLAVLDYFWQVYLFFMIIRYLIDNDMIKILFPLVNLNKPARMIGKPLLLSKEKKKKKKMKPRNWNNKFS